MATEPGLDLSSIPDGFEQRHIGSNEHDLQLMLNSLNLRDLEELTRATVPESIRLRRDLQLSAAVEGERQALKSLHDIMKRNQLFRSFIGTGYYNTVTPPVILRNILENPSWYTPYTPYQAEISQGRLESLFNFQTMVGDLTGLKYANASLLDEATAGAEAMTFCLRTSKSKSRRFFVASDVHPQTKELIRTRAEPLHIQVVEAEFGQFAATAADGGFFGAVIQYPNTFGLVHKDIQEFVDQAHAINSLVCVATDLLALTLLKPPSEFGVDVAFGSAQRFGVPLGYGGPHAAFFSIASERDARKLPGRIIGMSKDASGQPAYRLALQTREQHIRRDKATSNICTAQALLANIATMYAVYHGPAGLKRIAVRIHHSTVVLKSGLQQLGHSVADGLFFDTLQVFPASWTSVQQIVERAQTEFRINLRVHKDGKSVGVSLDETVQPADLDDLFRLFSHAAVEPFPSAIQLAAKESCLIASSESFYRTKPILQFPVFNSFHTEHELLRYIHRLSSKDLALTHSMISLGSCTMKLNATSEMIPVTWPEVGALHPFVPVEQASGYATIIHQLEESLTEITGFHSISFQPNAGAQGEYAGLMTIRKYLQSIGQGHRDICLIPSSAHGTNPASASMAGMRIEVIECDTNGYIDVDSLREKLQSNTERLAAIMITYPSTFGIFEEKIKSVAEMIHAAGGQVYLDGANMNAMTGLCRPGDIGADVCHLNLHKTFCIPHGGGGPGMGPIGVAKHLAPFLPSHPFLPGWEKAALGPVSASPFASASILPITWMYLRMMGAGGIRRASQVAILNANYMRWRLQDHFAIRFRSTTGFVAHEFIIDFNPFKSTTGIDVADVSKRLMDYNFHSPTMSWPVPGTLMVEPTESESKAELDRFCDAMLQIRKEITEIEQGKYAHDNNVLKNAPHTAETIARSDWPYPYSREKAAYPLPYVREFKFWPSVSRVDNAFGDTHLVCSCAPVDSYKN